MKRNCHQDWLMGRCGRVQEAAGPTPRGNVVKSQQEAIFQIIVFNFRF